MLPCSDQRVRFLVDVKNVLVDSVFEDDMSHEDRSRKDALLDAERSLLPEQRTLHRVLLAEDWYWVKVRPAALDFIRSLAEVGEVFAFTIGSGYAPHHALAAAICVSKAWLM